MNASMGSTKQPKNVRWPTVTASRPDCLSKIIAISIIIGTGAIPPGVHVFPDCPSRSTTDIVVRDIVQYLVQEHGARPYGRLRAFPAASCQEISHAHPDLGEGFYWLSEDGGEPTKTYCNL